MSAWTLALNGPLGSRPGKQGLHLTRSSSRSVEKAVLGLVLKKVLSRSGVGEKIMTLMIHLKSWKDTFLALSGNKLASTSIFPRISGRLRS